MSKLVILNQGMAGRTFELNIERTTVGRVEDNTFQIADGSVSSHHAEILLRGSDVVIRDLNSTNGTFINNEKVAETVLKPGQTLRFGQVELKIDDGRTASAPSPAAPPAPAGSASAPSAAPAPTAPVAAPSPGPARRTGDGTMIMTRGVTLEQLEQGGTRAPGFDTKGTGFSKKKSSINTYFIIGGVVVALIIVGLILYALTQVKSGPHQ